MKKFIMVTLVALFVVSMFGIFSVNSTISAEQRGKELFDKINNYRVSQSLEKIKWHENCYVVAYNHTTNMHNTSRLAHNLDGKGAGDRLKNGGIIYSCYVENVAFNQGQADPIQSAFDQWKKSDGHNKNMLDDCAIKGAVAIVSSPSKGYYFTFLAFTGVGDDEKDDPNNTIDNLIKTTMEKGGKSCSYTMKWMNTGQTNMNITWKIEYQNGAGWILVSPTSAFLTPGQEASFDFSFTSSNLSAGIYRANLVFTHEFGGHTIPIELTVVDPGMKTVELWIGSDVMRVNGETVRLDAPPAIVSGRTVVPVRAISEAFDAKVGWDNTEKKVTITLGINVIEMWIDSSTAFVGATKATIDPPPMIISGRTFVPFRFIGEALGATVSWDGDERKVTLVIE